MRLTFFIFLAFFLLVTSCERKLSAAEVKDNLEKAMSAYLKKQQRPGTPPLNFKMLDVDYYQDASNYYLCNFKVKLYRPDGTDTTGFITGRVSNDFSKVSGK
jgi:hypothetical protein